MATNRSFSSLVNVQSKSINFKFGHFWAKYQGYSLTFWPKIPHFHHFSMVHQNQSISNLVIFEQNTKAIALLFGQKSLIFITCRCSIIINQFQVWWVLSKNTKAMALLFGQKSSVSSLFNGPSKSINFKFGHFWAKYQGYSLMFWPKIPHFHHFSMVHQNQSISTLVIIEQNTKAMALLLGQKSLIFITFQWSIQNQSISNLVILSKIPRL